MRTNPLTTPHLTPAALREKWERKREPTEEKASTGQGYWENDHGRFESLGLGRGHRKRERWMFESLGLGRGHRKRERWRFE